MTGGSRRKLGLSSYGVGLTGPGGLIQSTQTAGAYLHLLYLALDQQSLFVDVGLEPGFSVPVGVADVIAGHSGFQANVASHSSLSRVVYLG